MCVSVYVCVFCLSAFRCAYCYVMNPARKTRPQAPRLPEFNFERRLRSESPDPQSSAASNTPEDSDAHEGTTRPHTHTQIQMSYTSSRSCVTSFLFIIFYSKLCVCVFLENIMSRRRPCSSLGVTSWSKVHSFSQDHTGSTAHTVAPASNRSLLTHT